MNMTRSLLPFALSLACAGCLELTQEVWVNSDGSGRMRLDIALPRELLEMASEADGANPLAETLQEYERLKADREAGAQPMTKHSVRWTLAMNIVTYARPGGKPLRSR